MGMPGMDYRSARGNNPFSPWSGQGQGPSGSIIPGHEQTPSSASVYCANLIIFSVRNDLKKVGNTGLRNKYIFQNLLACNHGKI